MVLICGTQLRVGELPFGDVMQYKIVPPAQAGVALKITAKTAKCVAVYVSEDLAVAITPDIRDKTTLFKDDADLLRMLEGSSDMSLEAQQAVMEMDAELQGTPVSAEVPVMETPVNEEVPVMETPVPVAETEEKTMQPPKRVLTSRFKRRQETQQAAVAWVCPGCGSESTAKFCAECGTPKPSEEQGTAIAEETPVVEETPVIEETPVVEETIVPETTEDIPVVEETAEVNEGTPIADDTEMPEFEFDDDAFDDVDEGTPVEDETLTGAPVNARDVEDRYVTAQERRIKELEAEINVMSQERADPEEFKQLTERLATEENQYKVQLQEKDTLIADLQAQLEQVKNVPVADNTAELAEKDKLISEKQAEIDQLKSVIEAVNNTDTTETDKVIAEKDAEIAQLKSVIEAVNSADNSEELAEKDKLISEKQAEIDQLKSVIEAVNSAGSTEVETLKAEIADKDSRITAFETEKAALEQQIVEMSQKAVAEPAVDTTEIEALQQKLTDAETSKREMQIKLDSAYEEVKANERQITEMRETYETSIKSLEESKRVLERQLEDVGNIDSDLGFCDGYAENVRAMITPEEETSTLTTMDFSDTYVMSFGTGESLRKIMGDMYHKIFLKGNYFVVDMTFDIALTGMHRTKCVSIPYTDMAQQGFDLSGYTVPIGGSVALLCGVMHDIGLLTLDWGTFMQNVKAAAKGKQIILLLPPMSSFAIKYAYTKLGMQLTGASMLYALIGNPHIVQQSLCELRYLPNIGLTVVVSDCPTDNNKLLLTLKNAGNGVFTTKFFKETIDFSQIGLNV